MRSAVRTSNVRERVYLPSIHNVIVIVCCTYSLYPGICSVLFSLGITSFSANHRLGLASINSAPGARTVS